MKFKIGDKVIGNKMATEKYAITIEGWVGTVNTVDSENGRIRVNNDKEEFIGEGVWVDADFFDLYKEGVAHKEIKIADKIEIDKIIFNDPATILYANGKRYVSKAYNEAFDEEKGLLMCLIKAFGISHLDLQRMIKGATVQEKKAPKDKKEKFVKGSGHLVEEVPAVPSPKGRKRGKSYIFNVDDKVLVRDCDQYENTTNSTARAMLNKVWRVQDIDTDDTIVVNGVHFAKCELEKLKF